MYRYLFLFLLFVFTLSAFLLFPLYGREMLDQLKFSGLIKPDFNQVQFSMEGSDEKISFGATANDNEHYEAYQIVGIVASRPQETDELIKLKIFLPKGAEILDSVLENNMTINVILGDKNQKSYGVLVVDNYSIPRKQEWKELSKDELFAILSKGKGVIINISVGIGPKSREIFERIDCDADCKKFYEIIEKYGEGAKEFFEDPKDSLVREIGKIDTLIINKD